MPYPAAELRSLRGPIRGAPPIRMGGPTEQYLRSRGQQKSFGLGQLYAQPQAPEFTGWTPGPLQMDPIRRVGDKKKEDELSWDEQLERYGQKLRTAAEIQEEFDEPERKAKRIDAEKKRIRKEIALERASKLAPEELREDVIRGTITPLSGYAASQRQDRAREADIKSANLEMALTHALLETGRSLEEAMPIAEEAVLSGRASTMLGDIRRKSEADAREQASQKRRDRQARMLPSGPDDEIRASVRRGDRTYAQGRSEIVAGKKKRVEAAREETANARVSEFVRLDEAAQEDVDRRYREAAAQGDVTAELVLRKLEKLQSREERAFFRY